MRKGGGVEQVAMQFKKGRGGARAGAGRPRKRDPGVSHGPRPKLPGRYPVHVTVRVRKHVVNLRTWRCFQLICAAFTAACDRFGMRVIALSVQGNHLHLLLEAACAAALARGMKGLEVRLARALNRLMGIKGSVFTERFHVRVLRNPRQVRAALAYIMGNTAKHARQVGRPVPTGYRDRYTVGYFGARTLLPEGTAGMVVPPKTWLLRFGWQRGTAEATSAKGSASRAGAPAAARRPSPKRRASSILELFPAGGVGAADRMSPCGAGDGPGSGRMREVA